HLPAPGGARGCRPREIAEGGPLQVSRHRHGTARAARGPLARARPNGGKMRINLTSVLVDDQEKALQFYTDVLGFVKKTDVPLGEDRWLTVVSPEEPDGTELVLEPDGHVPAAQSFKQALVADGIPYTS